MFLKKNTCIGTNLHLSSGYTKHTAKLKQKLTWRFHIPLE